MIHNKMTIGRMYPNLPLPGIEPVKQQKAQLPTSQSSFQQLLDQELLNFSGHAKVRMNERGIRLSAEDVANIEQAVGKAASKGAKESLIMLNDVALIVNIPNKTVVTAMDKNGLSDHVFTNIDSAVIL